ncbi:hypothetical protein ACIQD1_31345 [Streptomyces sp. NPDC093088]|uniref:hypothetical protein n=1 Tax=Streptomyces sp. NPDC093088 TaxID=3366023 RepID=UPI0037FE9619
MTSDGSTTSASAVPLFAFLDLGLGPPSGRRSPGGEQAVQLCRGSGLVRGIALFRSGGERAVGGEECGQVVHHIGGDPPLRVRAVRKVARMILTAHAALLADQLTQTPDMYAVPLKGIEDALGVSHIVAGQRRQAAADLIPTGYTG